LRPGLEYLRQNRMELKQKRYDEAVVVIRQWQDTHFLPRLSEVIEPR
jgi:hypothetical protein